MHRYFLEIAYKGTEFSGWQRQNHVPTVQQVIEDQMAKILKRKIRIHGCGRTDAGVHAFQYFFHADFTSDPLNLLDKLRLDLPSDIAIVHIYRVSPRFNAQKSALSRTYVYKIHQIQDPFLSSLSYYEPFITDLESMNTALAYLHGQHDFRYFCKRPDKNKNCMCTIKSASLQIQENKNMVFEFNANRFLHHMIRLIMGNLLKVGKGYLELEQFKAYIDLKEKPKYFELAPPQGLYLSKIEYEFPLIPLETI